jgi:hypothetical protein
MQARGICTARGFAASSGSILFEMPTKRIWQRRACSCVSALAKIWNAIGFQCSATHSGSHAPGCGAFGGTIRNFAWLSKHLKADSDRAREASDDIRADRVSLLQKVTFAAVTERNAHIRHHYAVSEDRGCTDDPSHLRSRSVPLFSLCELLANAAIAASRVGS